MQTVIDASANGALAVEPVGLVTNRRDAFAAERARRAGLPVQTLVWDRTSESRAAYDERVLAAVASTSPDVVLLLGWMHLLAPSFIAAFPHIINIHPAYLPLDSRADATAAPDGSTLPAFRGAHAIRDALAAGSRWYGATVHRVTNEVDRGAVLARTAVPLAPSCEVEALAALRPVEAATLRAALSRNFEREIDYMSVFEFTGGSVGSGNDEVRIDVPRGIERREELFAVVARALGAPQWFASRGDSWDAFNELFGERSPCTAGRIVVQHHDVPLASRPAEARVYLSLLAAARDANVGIERAFRNDLPAVGNDTIVSFPPALRERVVALVR